VLGHRRFTDLLTVGGRIHYETHMAPLLSMQGSISGFALDLRAGDGRRLPVLVAATAVRGPGGALRRIRVVVFEARDRRTYESELLRARRDADRERDRIQRLATVLQQTLLPPRLPEVPGLDAAAYYHPASLDDVGGDFYDLFRLPDGRGVLPRRRLRQGRPRGRADLPHPLHAALAATLDPDRSGRWPPSTRCWSRSASRRTRSSAPSSRACWARRAARRGAAR
jgi:hypothetical protein